MKVPCAAVPITLGFAVLMAYPAVAQNVSASVQTAWDNLLQDTIPKTLPDPALKRPQETASKGAAGDFLNHFYFESRSDYSHSATDFTGLPTLTGLINAPFSNTFNPAGYPYQAAFQPTADRFMTFLDFGTRGWLSNRVDTHFAVEYRTDLSHVNLANPNANILETYNSDRLIELLTADVTIHGLPTDGFFSGATLDLGRQHVYGAEVADFDGATLTINRQQFSFDIFGGRRFTYYEDPVQRAIGGADVTWRIDPLTSVSYGAVGYIHTSQRLSFRRRMSRNLTLISYFRVFGGSPVDFDVDAFYQSANGKTSIRGGFFQKLTDKDYAYDYTEGARDRDAYNAVYRLNYGMIEPYSQFVIDAHHTFAPWLFMGGSIWWRHLNDNTNEGPFNTSFQDYRINSQFFPVRKLQTSLEYHQRNTDRILPDPTVPFSDITAAGETSVKDLTGELRRSFFEGGRLVLNGGVYYRRISLQDQFLTVSGAHQTGWLSGISLKADQRTRIFIDYTLDNDFFIFNPDIKRGRILRVGLAWKY